MEDGTKRKSGTGRGFGTTWVPRVPMQVPCHGWATGVRPGKTGGAAVGLAHGLDSARDADSGPEELPRAES